MGLHHTACFTVQLAVKIMDWAVHMGSATLRRYVVKQQQKSLVAGDVVRGAIMRTSSEEGSASLMDVGLYLASAICHGKMMTRAYSVT